MANLTGNLMAASAIDDADPANALYLKLKAASKNQVQMVRDLGGVGEPGLNALMRFLADYHQTLVTAPSVADDITIKAPGNTVLPLVGTIYQVLFSSGSTAATVFLQTYFPQGVVPLRSEAAIDYMPLQQLLAEQNFQAADQLTLQKMCEVVGAAAVQRKWLYFTEIEQFPIADLQTLNALWLAHSEGRFGFSIQRELWLSVGKNWDQLWSKIGWRSGSTWTRYPQGFTWVLSAPRGHLPLSNQLRGVRGIASLLAHPAWS
ncbi:MAG: GUN4 domain-containing protein [Stenomitos frigidus ULC029]